MKRGVAVLLVLFCAVPVAAFDGGKVSGTCEECPPGAGCVVRYGGCGETTCDASCVAGKWTTSGKCFTYAIHCPQDYEFTPAEIPSASKGASK
jgi:hypothetical protein